MHSQPSGVDWAVRWDDSKSEVDPRLRRAVHSARYRSAGAHGGTLGMRRGGQQGEGQCSNEELCKLHLHFTDLWFCFCLGRFPTLLGGGARFISKFLF